LIELIGVENEYLYKLMCRNTEILKGAVDQVVQSNTL